MIPNARTHTQRSRGLIFSSDKKRRMDAVERAASRYAMITEGDRVLHLECGSGALLNMLSQKAMCRLYGTTNNSAHMRETRTTLPSADIVYTEPDDIPWKGTAFNVIIAAYPDSKPTKAEEFLRKVLNSLCQGGQFVMIAPWHPVFQQRMMGKWFSGSAAYESQTCFSRYESMALLESAGYQAVSWYPLGIGKAVITGWREREKT